MKRHVLALGCLAALQALNALAGECKSPSDFVTRVYSSNGHQIEYQLRPDRTYQEITVIFFGKKDYVQRENTTVRLEAPKGAFPIPERALIAPAQLWFNFVVLDETGCKTWGLVNEVPLAEKANVIVVGDPSGEGKAFYIRK